jgi:hypothetical protein
LSVGRVTLGCMTEVSVDPILGMVEQSCLAGAEAALRAGGFIPEPQVHMFIDDWAQPYVGYVISRPYHRGRDAAEAIVGLGAAPAAIKATRILIAWEEADLWTSLCGPADYPTGFAVVIATWSTHVLHWHPFSLHMDGRPLQSGLPSVRPQWDECGRVPAAELPLVIVGLIERWRSLAGERATVYEELGRAGYRLTTFPA